MSAKVFRLCHWIMSDFRFSSFLPRPRKWMMDKLARFNPVTNRTINLIVCLLHGWSSYRINPDSQLIIARCFYPFPCSNLIAKNSAPKTDNSKANNVRINHKNMYFSVCGKGFRFFRIHLKNVADFCHNSIVWQDLLYCFCPLNAERVFLTPFSLYSRFGSMEMTNDILWRRIPIFFKENRAKRTQYLI